MLWALSALGWLRSAFRAALALMVKYPLQVALCAFLLACVWLWHGWSHERAARHADAVAFQQASDANRAAQIAANHVPAANSQAIAEKSDAQAPAYYRRFADAADAHRVRPAPGVGPASVPGADPAGPGVHGPDAVPGADLVCRPRADDDFLTRSTARLALVLADVKALIASGAATPADHSPTESPAP